MILSDKIGQRNIANTLSTQYSDLLNSVDVNIGKKEVPRMVKKCNNKDLFMFTVDDVKDSVKHLKSGKSCGIDRIQAEHFKYADDRVYALLSILFNIFISHGYTIIIPVF